MGLFGVFVCLASYFALQAGLMSGQGFLYPILNMGAAGSVLITLQTDFNLPSVLVQLSWIAISFIGIGRLLYLRSLKRLTEEEQAILRRKLPNLDLARACRFFDLRQWTEIPAGKILTIKDS